MAQWAFALSIIAVFIAVAGGVYTYRLGRQQKWQGELDAPLPEKVQEHAYLRNPVLLAYVSAFLLAAIVILFLALRYG
ncbi:hypothetical protein [Parageobacillus thermoglucosidasius]|uniref:Uncharacterized protein n=3 Tax=Anoxybacillaceae TaxID=3120669 RepID=A0AAN0YPE7_PARTM|nr:hypothetical protein [Parageobacillus thermoglucosidasius]KYD14982.1 hypothetical protein B4168_2191 [Anoxybacillus flavithermus]REK54884.1 MAG: hypothetical protein C6P36_12370 [Geobacillus sp.]AEH48764.1 hypothetical protein Geoth_2877 [Parageobacillus thermoglucosidasius C56-YS93]ALF09989.1 hypothetical protein AOT13_08205 [Parageobacillus thermoglucosidasius]ANZ30070.1 hypothetical protein BCV53_08215 [Parageobacillus thermoglucosidasius]